MLNRKLKDGLANVGIWLAAAMSVGLLVVIITFIFSNGWQHISLDFLRNHFNEEMTDVNFTVAETFEAPSHLGDNQIFAENLGLTLEQTEDGYKVAYIDANSPVKEAVDNNGSLYPVRTGQLVERINGERVDGETAPEDILAHLEGSGDMTMRVRVLGGGVLPMIVSTVALILVTLVIAAPFGIMSAIYMTEYAKPGRFVSLVRFATGILAGIPSVVYGLFGMLMFSGLLGLGRSILAGALTMSILLLPIMMRTTEEALRTVPMSYREASYALGTYKIQTISRVVLPSALPGIMVGIILSIGRIVGESAALIFTVGTFASFPVDQATGHFSVFETGATLTLRAFIEVKETGNVTMAAAIGIVILVIVFVLNIISRIITSKFTRAND